MQTPYSDVAADDPRLARRIEGEAFDRVIEQLEQARTAGPESYQSRDALDGVDRLWAVLLHDLTHPHNALPDALRAQLISIGLWVIREVAQVRTRVSASLEGLIAVNASIRAGLR